MTGLVGNIHERIIWQKIRRVFKKKVPEELWYAITSQEPVTDEDKRKYADAANKELLAGTQRDLFDPPAVTFKSSLMRELLHYRLFLVVRKPKVCRLLVAGLQLAFACDPSTGKTVILAEIPRRGKRTILAGDPFPRRDNNQ